MIAEAFRRLTRRRFKGVRQRDQTDCGAACMAAVCAHFGLRIPVARIRQMISTDRQGSTVLGLVDGAARLGFTARAVRASREALGQLPLPAIAHTTTVEGLGHYVVVERVTAHTVRIMDPRDGKVRGIVHDTFAHEWTGVLVLLAPADGFAIPDSAGHTPFARLVQLGLPHRRIFLQALIGAAVYTLLGLSTAIFVQKLVDHVLPGGNQNLLNLMGLAMLFILAGQMGLGILKDLLIVRTGQRIDGGLILGYYRHVLGLPQRFFDTMRVGEVVSRVNDAVKIRAFINDIALELAVSAVVVLLSFGLMFIYSPSLALLMAAVIPVYAATYWTTNRLNRSTQRRMMEHAADLEAEFVESIGAASTVKRFGIEGRASDRVEQRLVRTLRAIYRSTITSIGSGTASDMASRATVIVALWAGGTMVLAQQLTAGELLSFYALVGYLSSPVMALIASNRSLQDALIAADRLFEIMDLEGEQREGSLEPGRPLGDIVFEDVHFRYGARGAVLHGVTARIPAGEISLVVGASGCGKTTLASLLQALYPVDQGTIRLGGTDLRRIDPAALRRRIGVVPQEIHLFAGSIIENIVLDDSEPDMQRLLGLCDDLGITEFCDRLPHGMTTHVGERGTALSGGQRQRVAIARALYRRPDLLILDEATSGLDPESEAQVERVVRRFARDGGTVLLITHRLALARLASTVLVMAEGRVVETGTHDELLALGGTYAELWYQQFPAELAMPIGPTAPAEDAKARESGPRSRHARSAGAGSVRPLRSDPPGRPAASRPRDAENRRDGRRVGGSPPHRAAGLNEQVPQISDG